MLPVILRGFAFAATAVAAGAAFATEAAPAADKFVGEMFNKPHIADVAAGTELVYKFERKPSDEKLLGLGFSDNIKVNVEKEASAGKKSVLLQIYSGDRARDPHRINEMDGNPLLVVYLDNAVAHFRELAGGDRDYLKNTFKKKMSDGSKVEPVTIDYKGEKLAGYRLVLTPYASDPARAKMRGYEGATFSIAMSDKIPGYFAQMVSMFSNANKGAPTLEERTTLDGVGEVK